MSFLDRVRASFHILLHGIPVIEDDLGEPFDCKDDPDNPQQFIPWQSCRWFEARYRCTIPKGSDEPAPSGCDHACPARLEELMRAEYLERENTDRFYR